MKKPALSNIIYSIVAILMAAAVFYVIRFPIKSREGGISTGTKIEFRKDGNGVVTEKDVLERIGGLAGKTMKELNFSKIEKTVRSIQGVKEADAYWTPDGRVCISILEREPFLRIHYGENSWWVDDEGSAFPIQGNSYKDIPSVDGCSDFSLDPKWLKGTIGMVKEIDRNKRWRGQFDRISVDSKGEYVLHPKDGKVKVVFGGPSDVEEKLVRLERFYEKIIPAYGDSTYRSVNVKYKGQVICRK